MSGRLPGSLRRPPPPRPTRGAHHPSPTPHTEWAPSRVHSVHGGAHSVEWSPASATEWRPSAHSTRWAALDGSAMAHPRGGHHSMPRCHDTDGTHSQPTDEEWTTGGRRRQPEARSGRESGAPSPNLGCPPPDTFGRCPFSPLHPLDPVHRTSRSPLDRPRLHPLTMCRATSCFPLTSARVKGKPGGSSPGELRRCTDASGSRP